MLLFLKLGLLFATFLAPFTLFQLSTKFRFWVHLKLQIFYFGLSDSTISSNIKMASLNSLSFMIETRISRHTSNGSNPLSNQRRKPLDCGVFLKFMEHNGNTLSSLCCVKSVSESRRIDLWRNTSLKATENESSESEDNREPKDAIQATIDKSSKVLAMYKELLKQRVLISCNMLLVK
ncbi:uncharacterized protein LOC130828825 isoform X3 [Amaranthus tricolor]|uniref:uncharacterized protein LOC130828825 isoform X3 n=1 Tax=Amaranthus tricolor TaxID=29722 RepID=UPI0025843AFD|nr:uncharacterized protein LOC130828825 isoform X3 [Amaranthus tricolor]